MRHDHKNGKFSKYNNEIEDLHYNSYLTHLDITDKLLSKFPEIENRSSFLRYVREHVDQYIANKDVIEENVKLAKKNQRLQDTNRIERKSFRHHARIENAVIEFNKSLIELIREEGLKIETVEHENIPGSCKLGLQLSDLHLNELIDLPDNKYDFTVASQRLFKLAEAIISVGKWQNTNTLFIGFLGDMLNSDRRLDELLSMATNRAKATQLSIRLLTMFLLHLNKYFNIYLAGVTGNESRAKQELGWSDIMATDSYDYTIYDNLRLLLRDKPGFHFEMMEANEKIVTINGKKILLIHGHQVKGKVQNSVQQIIGKYACKGINIDYVWFGHIHSSNVGDYFSRNASLAGSNAYSEEALNFVSKAAQNLHIIYESDTIHSMKIDLQDITGIVGYPIESDVDAYNAKSVKKTKAQKTIFELVI